MCLPKFNFSCVWDFFSRIFVWEFFFSESRLFTRPLFSHFVRNLDWLASQPILWIPPWGQSCGRWLFWHLSLSVNILSHSHDHFSKILRTFFASRNYWIIIVFLQCTQNEKLPFVLINTLLLHIPLLALTHPQTEWRTERQIHSLHMGWRNFFSSYCAAVSVFWFWREIGFGVTY